MENEYGWASIEEWAGEDTFAQVIENWTHPVPYTKANDGWWTWDPGTISDSQAELYMSLNQCHPTGSYSYSDSTLANTRVIDFTGDQAVITVTFNPNDTATYSATSMTITFKFK